MPTKKGTSAKSRSTVKSASKSTLKAAGDSDGHAAVTPLHPAVQESQTSQPPRVTPDGEAEAASARSSSDALPRTVADMAPTSAQEELSTDQQRPGSRNSTDVVVPSSEQLLRSRRLQAVADQLSHSLVVLRTKLTRLERRIQSNGEAAVLPFQIRRAMAEKEELKKEINHTNRTIQRLLVMSDQLQNVMDLRATVFAERQAELQDAIAKLLAERSENKSCIRDGFVDRINLLHRYWPWRQLLALGDTSVASTFQEELARGPRYRHVGIQNNIQSDYIEQQLHWLEALSSREETFRTHLRQLDSLVEDLIDINDLLETTLTCSVCHLLFEEPVIFWPCGHSFCVLCFDSLAIAPSLYRCPVCGSMGSEGFVHNLLLNETVAKWMFKDAGYGDVQGPLNSIRMHLSRFRKDRIESRVVELKALLQEHQKQMATRGVDDSTIAIAYRAY